MTTSEASFDLVIVGAGPAGMAAAIEAAQGSMSVVVLDEQPMPGGQVHRAIEQRKYTGKQSNLDDRDGAALVQAFRNSAASYCGGTAVWQIEREGEGFAIFVSSGDAARCLKARRLIIATGAIERPVPMPGWTLPGVMTVGAAQILLKTGGNVPTGQVVIAGQGPLALLYATQLLAAGVKPAACLNTTMPGALDRALRHLPGALGDIGQIGRGLGFMARLRLGRVPLFGGVSDVAAHGDERLSSVSYVAKGIRREIKADLLLLHEGVVPHTHLAMSMGAEHRWDEGQSCWQPRLGADGQTSIEGLRIAGDGAGIGGWRIAALDGRLAARAMMRELGRETVPSLDGAATVTLRRQRQRLAGLRPFLDAWFRPRAVLQAPPDDVIVCRCEELTAGDLRAAIRQGCLGPNQVKSFTRCGMGPCQGRECALTLTTLVAAERGITPEEAGALRIRPPLKPLTLGELAALAPTGA